MTAVPVMLVVGELRRWEAAGRALPVIDGFHFAGFDQLDADLLGAVRPDVVLSALIGVSCDALDVARRLADLGYDGRYRAIASDLPDTDVILREVHQIAPDLDFDVLIFPL